jgi:hypothetical protein
LVEYQRPATRARAADAARRGTGAEFPETRVAGGAGQPRDAADEGDAAITKQLGLGGGPEPPLPFVEQRCQSSVALPHNGFHAVEAHGLELGGSPKL